jgi:hypothetical protein
MTPDERKMYEALRHQITPRRDDLDNQFEQLPNHIMEAAERAAASVSKREELDYLYKLEISNAADRLRNPSDGSKKPPEEAIKQLVLGDEAVYTAWQTYDQAREDSVMWAGLVDVLKVKKSCMDRLADFTLSGYISAGKTSHDGNRAALTGARRAAIKE